MPQRLGDHTSLIASFALPNAGHLSTEACLASQSALALPHHKRKRSVLLELEWKDLAVLKWVQWSMKSSLNWCKAFQGGSESKRRQHALAVCPSQGVGRELSGHLEG